MIGAGLSAPVTPASLDASLSGFRAALRQTMQETPNHAGLAAADVLQTPSLALPEAAKLPLTLAARN